MYIVRYADDFKIFTNTRSNAEKIFRACQMWLEERLKLPISTEKFKVTNLKKQESEFLGFSLKAVKKGKRKNTIYCRNTRISKSTEKDEARFSKTSEKNTENLKLY